MNERKFVIVTRERAQAYWGDNRPAVEPPAGLYPTRGDGVAVPVTAEMLARLWWGRHIPWDRISEASREHEAAQAESKLAEAVAGLTKVLEEMENDG